MIPEYKCRYDAILQVDEVAKNPQNPNKHSEAQIERLAKIIEYYGWRHPIIISKQTNQIVVGHGRLEAAKKLGLKECPVVYQDFKDADEEMQFLIADNGISEWSELDYSLINMLIGDFDPGYNVDLLGLEDFTVDVSEKMNESEDEEDKEDKAKCPTCGK